MCSSRLLCLLLLTSVASSEAQDALSEFVDPQVGYFAANADLVPKFVVDNVTECAATCLSTAGCISFNYCSPYCGVSGYNWSYTLAGPGAPCSYYLKIKPRNDTEIRPAIAYKLEVPRSGVKLGPGVLLNGFNANIAYLRQAQIQNLLHQYNVRAGIPNPDNSSIWGWDSWVKGSYGAEFLMGAGGVLRWEEVPDLREKLDQFVAGVKNAANADGFLMAFNESEIIDNNNPDYVVSWVTHGLLEASIAGNEDALPMARAMIDWYNNCTYLPQWLPPISGVGELPGDKPPGYNPDIQNGDPGFGENSGHLIYMITQGMIHNTRMASSSVGRQADVDLLLELFKEDWWLRQFIEGNLSAVWLREYFPHNYEITSYEAYLDLYTLTSNTTFLDAMLSAWTMINENWEHVGGSIAINEGQWYEPQSYHITYDVTNHPGPTASRAGKHAAHHHHHDHDDDDHAETKMVGGSNGDHPTGETCGSVFWVKFNQRFHGLFPAEDRYVAEIEKEIYNVGIANIAADGSGIRYFTNMNNLKQMPSYVATCCEGQGTRLLGSLPEYVFSIIPNGVMVDLYTNASIDIAIGSEFVNVNMTSSFPYGTDVSIVLSTDTMLNVSLQLRIPAWTAGEMVVIDVGSTSGRATTVGLPGQYTEVSIALLPNESTTVTFDLPMAFTATKYIGVNQVANHSRFAYEYGPILLAATGPLDADSNVVHLHGLDAANPSSWMSPVDPNNMTLHFNVTGNDGVVFVPYFEIQDSVTTFSVYPIVDA